MTEVSNSIITPNNPENPLAEVDQETVLFAVEIFQQRFAMFSFLHGPTLLSLIYGKRALDLRFCGILAVCARFIPKLIRRHGGSQSASEHFAAYLRSKITCQTARGYEISVAQALLLLSFHDWGSAKGVQAWTYIGMATRNCCSILARLANEKAHKSKDALQTETEEARRTLWACLMIESLLGCGHLRSLSLHAKIYNVPLPTSDEDYAFGVCRTDDPKYLEVLDLENSDPPNMQRLTGNSHEIDFALVIQGFNIWCEVSRWISTGGNRSGATILTEGTRNLSSFWTRSLMALKDWREIQPPRFHYTLAGSHLQAFISRKQGERYALVNLIFFLTTIFLYREHVPLVPRNAQEMDRPESASFRGGASIDWPKDSANRLSESALSIIRMMNELTSQGLTLHVPFTCYCVFNAITILSYVKRWPATSLRHGSVVESFNWGFEWLSKASETWEVARAWKATLMKIESSHDCPPSESQIFPRSEAEFESLSDLAIPTAGQEPTTQPRQPGMDQNTTSGSNTAARPNLTTLDDIMRWGSSASYSDMSWLSINSMFLDYDLMMGAQEDPTVDPVNSY
ncbi:hypothetical protein N7532_010077 [Penicillium argentinense]|uniref:Xylanolytic transcriptional activator regulatory domain-containing protein n=1 Tax=Penicillium argentinense TaxID=1131581 RepID=A0A9W9JXS8_9EURO|nr:uncharacterized protein N7532_010077 [Penicillium argentinense]KAJ5085306.1 hypothetical protein N7532_010077 [Penicillium argentinense]